MFQSSASGVYANIGSSAVQELKQRLQVIPTTPAPAPAPLYFELDDDDSLQSDVPGEERFVAALLFCCIFLVTVFFALPNEFIRYLQTAYCFSIVSLKYRKTLLNKAVQTSSLNSFGSRFYT